MSGLDVFAWIVLTILVASIVGVFCIAGWLPGHIAKTGGHPQAQAVTVAGWVQSRDRLPGDLNEPDAGLRNCGRTQGHRGGAVRGAREAPRREPGETAGCRRAVPARW